MKSSVIVLEQLLDFYDNFWATLFVLNLADLSDSPALLPGTALLHINREKYTIRGHIILLLLYQKQFNLPMNLGPSVTPHRLLKYSPCEQSGSTTNTSCSVWEFQMRPVEDKDKDTRLFKSDHCGSRRFKVAHNGFKHFPTLILW